MFYAFHDSGAYSFEPELGMFAKSSHLSMLQQVNAKTLPATIAGHGDT